MVLEIGNRVRLTGGYGFEPAWLSGNENLDGTLVCFIPGQNHMPAAVIKIESPITFEAITGAILVLELRYAGASWEETGIVHIELCDFMPEPAPWQDRRRGKWVESHATYARLPE